MKSVMLILLVICLSSCRPRLYIHYDDEYPRESGIVRELFQDETVLSELGIRMYGGKDPDKAEIQIRFHSSWEHEDDFGGIVLSRDILVPWEGGLSERTDTSLEACLGGEEALISLEELFPPRRALRVGGMDLSDPAYPLIKLAGISIRISRDKFQDKADALGELLSKRGEAADREQTDILWLAAGGDVMLGRGAWEILSREGPEGIFGKSASLLAEAGLALINLEGALSFRGEAVQKSYNFRFPPAAAAALKAAGVDAVLLANNHAFDWG
ncbi:CapA family protein, partial [Treponema sp. OttesenSCG-928-L16]|nr:CapA family protein [Treponema sp. OttesenSCG-928-L16]